MVYRNLLPAILAILVSTVAIAAQTPLHLEPSSKWHLNYGAERCTLTRDFGTDATAVHLQIDSFGAWNDFRVQLSGRPIPQAVFPVGSAAVRMSPDREAAMVKTLRGTVDNQPALSFNVGFGPTITPAEFKKMNLAEKQATIKKLGLPEPDYDAKVDRIDFFISSGPTLSLAVGNMAPPLAMLRNCVNDLYKSWGVDPVQQKSLSRPARPSKSTVNSVRFDFPGEPLLAGLSAYVPVRLLIDATGKVTSCVVQVEGIDEAFKKAVCTHLQGKFTPALNAAGKPVASLFYTSVIYLNTR
jgi:hypothetical protein